MLTEKSPTRRPSKSPNERRSLTAEFFGNKIAMIDPATGKVTEYDLPLKWGNPYELIADDEDNIWAEDGNYSSLVKCHRLLRRSPLRR